MSQTTIKASPATKQKASTLRKLNPTAQLPVASILRNLTPADRERLEKLTTEPLECVYHGSFRRARMPDWDDAEVAESKQMDDSKIFHPDPDIGLSAEEPTEVLTAGEERLLFLRFNYCRSRVMRVLAGHRGKRLSAHAMRELLHWDTLAQQNRTTIVRYNTSLVLAMARRSRNSGVELTELISEGNLALLRCVDKFDASRGFKFSTYACRAILASFSRAGAKAARHRGQFPTPYDPAMERSDHLERRREELEHECVDELKRILFENSADLSHVERRVLSARFSLDQRSTKARTGRRKTLDQVGDLLGVSKERVRQIQNQAMIKIRAVLEERLLAAS